MIGVTAGLHLQLLGRFQVRRDGVEVAPVAFGGRKVRTLLRVLAVRRPDLVPHGVLTDALWPDRPPADPVANLGVLVNRARRALGDPASIVTGAGGYALGDCTVDIEEFLDALARARAEAAAGQHAEALRLVSAALRGWGEPLAEDVYADWARQPRDRLLRARVDALELAAHTALALGDAAAAAGAAADAVAAEPLRESATMVLARALAAGGDRAAALGRLADLRRRLADELGVDPSAEVAQLQVALLRGEVPGPRRIGVPVLAAPRAPTFDGLAFVGRAAEAATLRAALAGYGVVALAGVGGVGKSRLLAEVARASPLPVLAARAFLPERAEAWGLARSVLREALAVDAAVAEGLPDRIRDALGAVQPELATGPAAPLDGESRRALVLAGGLRVLEAATGAGAALVVDDLQWADPSSITLLISALARLPRLAAVLAFRPDELPSGVLAELRGARAVTEVTLGPLSPAAVTELVRDPELAAALLAGTDGTPFAVAEVLRELAERRAVVASAGTFWTREGADAAALAAELGREGQRRAVRRRAGRQEGARADALAVVALLAREAAAGTVAATLGLGQREALDALAALAGAGLLRLGERGWATAHDLVGETVAADLPAGERGRLHGLLARALEAEGADPSEVARHHRDAGDTVAAAAAYARAAQAALAGHASREAATLADAGLALDPAPPVRGDLLEARAEARATHGELAGALADLHAAVAAGRGAARSRRLARLAMLSFGAQDARRAAELAELAVVEAGTDDGARAVALETAAIIDMNLAQADRATERAEEALGLYRRLGDAQGVARILDGRAMATFLEGRIAEGVAVFGRVAQVFEDSGELLRVVTPRSTRGHGLVFLARPAQGLQEASAALRLAGELDAPEGRAYALWHRSEALSGLGRATEAEADAREALAVARGVDHRGWTATAWRALGIALQEQRRWAEAAAAFAASGEVAGESLTLFASWAAARGAMVALRRGRPAEAAPLVELALAVGPPLGRYEGRLAQVELAVSCGWGNAPALARAALELARAGGHAVSVPRLAEVAAG
jgi:DNA-binding SARP family transcriptional activator